MASILRAFALLVICAPLWAADLSALARFSDRDTATGLREALGQGAARAVDLLGKQDGFLGNPKVKIPLPEVLQKAEPILRLTGQGAELDRLVTAMNRAAEAAVPEARSLLANAVKQMTVEDAKKILTGGDDSVTQYFRRNTEGRLTERFLPVVKQNTDRLALAGQYNALAGQAAGVGLLKSEDAQIESYVTRKALDGLYLMIAEEERAIRANPVGAAGTWAKRIFGAIK